MDYARTNVFILCMMSVLLASACMSHAESTGKPATTLRQAAQSCGVAIGASVDEDALREDPEYAAVLGREFNTLTPENSMKFEALHPGPFRYDFELGDAIVEFADKHQMQVHGHVLVWHEQLPDWLTGAKWTREQLRMILHEYIYRVVGHYRGRIGIWDVVSEAVDENGEMRKTFWSQGIGPEYIELAFQWAHEADPDAQLLYNDYGGEGSGAKADAIYKLLAGLRKRGVPVHGVGLQMHVSTDDAPSTQAVAANMARLEGVGLKVHVTEMDVSLKLPATPAKLARQARVYHDMMHTCLAAPGCRNFTLWGFTDRYSWIPEFFPGSGAALIFDKQMRPKPAYDALIEALSGH